MSKNGVQVFGSFERVAHPEARKQIADCMDRSHSVEAGLQHIPLFDVSLELINLNGHAIAAEFQLLIGCREVADRTLGTSP